ncbi:methyl-CpG-binding domain protein 4 isoform X2 [Lithobates pipiens]
MRGENLYTEHAPSGTFRSAVSRDGMAGSILDSIKVEPLDVSQPLREDEESQKDELSEDGTSSAPGTLPEGWRKIVTRRKTGKTAWRRDVYFISIKVEPLDVSEPLCEDEESQKDEPSEGGTSSAPGTLPEGWRKIVTQRKTGKTAGRHDVYFISPEGSKLRSKTALEKYLNTHHPEIKLEDFDYSVPSQQQRHGTSIVTEFINMDNRDRSAILSGVPEEPKDCAEGRAGDRPEGRAGDRPEGRAGDHPEDHAVDHPEGRANDHPDGRAGDHPEDHAEDHPEDHAEDHPEDHAEDHPEDHAEDHPEDHAEDHPEDHAEDHPEDHAEDHPEDHAEDHPEDHAEDHPEDHAEDHPEDHAEDHPEDNAEDHPEDMQNTEEDPFIEDENDRTPTMKCVGRKRVRSHRKGSEKALRTVARIKRPRKYSSTKPAMATKIQKYKRKNTVLKKPKKEESSETDTFNECQLQNSHRQMDFIKVKDPTDLCDPVTVSEDAEDQISTLPLEQQTGAENDQTASNSSDDNLLTSSGKTKDFITRSQVEKRKTSHYFSKKATRDVQTVKTQWCSMKDNYRRDLLQIQKEKRSASRANRMKSNFDKEEQDPSHVDPDEAEETSERNQLCPLSPMVSDNNNSATTVEATQEAESEVAGPLTSQPSGRLGLVSSCSPSNQSRHRELENQLLLALNTFMEQRQAEQSPMYHFAVSMVPLLDKVSEDRVVDVKRHVLDLIASYLSSDAPPDRLYVYPFNCQSCNRQLCSPPPYFVHAPVQHSLPDQSTSEVQIPPRSCTPLTPTLSSQPSYHSPFEEKSSSPVKTGQTRLTSCTLF